jgi:integrase
VQRTTVRRFTPHEIRHGFVTRAARAYGVLAASAAANHKNISTTQGYLHADREDAYRVLKDVALARHRRLVKTGDNPLRKPKFGEALRSCEMRLEVTRDG